jgi:hypothetical protein
VFDVQAEFMKFINRMEKARESGIKIEHKEMINSLLAVAVPDGVQK